MADEAAATAILSPSNVPADLNAVWNSTLGVDALCEANGYSKDEFLSGRASEATELELFLVVVPRCPPLQYFTNVTTLRLMHLGLTKIEQLCHLRRLRRLWLSENEIETIEGLANCVELQELYLNANHIRKIENLDRLTQLRTLSLQQNRIEVVEGVEHFTQLKHLSLAGNRIRSLGDALEKLTCLEELNLSANALSSFRVIVPLASIGSLEKLWFNDPVYGTNPLCALFNYETFTLFTLRRLKQLDHQVITQDQRTMAETTCVRKKIYYNMRIKTLKRNARLMLKKGEQFHSAKVAELQLVVSLLHRAIQELEVELSQFSKIPANIELLFGNETAAAPAIPDKQFVADARKKKTNLLAALEKRTSAIVQMGVFSAALNQRLAAQVNGSIRRLILELQTGGNVRLEEGRPKDVWYQSCSELLRTRYFPADFEAFGVKELRVTRVTKVYNRVLRSQFDQALEKVVDVSDPAYKLALEYLFVVEPEALDDEALFDVLEFGVSSQVAALSPPAHPGSKRARCVALTNSAFVAEHARLLNARKAGQLQGGNAFENPAWNGRVVVVKAFAGTAVAEPGAAVSGDQPLAALGPAVDNPDALSLVRRKPGDNKQKVWFMFEPRLVLPEYVIDFTLQPAVAKAEPDPTKASEVSEFVARAFPEASQVDVADLRSLAPNFLLYAQAAGAVAADRTDREEAAKLTAAEPGVPARSLQLTEDGCVDVVGMAQFLSTCEVPVGKEPEAAAFLVTTESINVVGTACKGVTKSLAAALTSLTRLVLSFSELSTLEFVCGLPHLIYLDVSHNVIRKLESLAPCGLTTLKLAGNLLYRDDDAARLVASVPALTSLSIVGNPIASDVAASAFVVTVLRDLSALQTFDLVPDSSKFLEMRKDVKARPTLLTAAVASVALQRHPLGSGKRRVEIHEVPLAIGTAGYAPLLAEQGLREEPSLLASATSLSCRGQCLSSATCFADPVPMLTQLDLGDNLFSSPHGLEPVAAQLEALALDGNRLSKVDDFGGFRQLRRLELSRNQITRLDGIEHLTGLAFLSVEDNLITSLSPLASLVHLSELYISNNRIASQKEMLRLRDLPRLIIADFAGNPCCAEDMYRLYAVFQLKKLKVLDGVAIESAEQVQARDVYAGRVSADLLNEHVDPPGTPWQNVTELSLSLCGIKELVLFEHFTALQHLRLDRNLISDITGLSRCAALVSLDLSCNKLALSATPIGRSLSELPALESLSLEGNMLTSVAGLQLQLPKLKFLNLKANEITKIDGLDGLPNLRDLVLDRNRIRSFDPNCFADIPYLRQLSCDENSIKVLDGLRSLVHLQKISLASNRLQEPAEILRALENSRQIVDATFLANQAARKQMYRTQLVHAFPLLAILDGKEVSPDERERADTYFQQETQMALIPPNVLTDVRPVAVPGASAFAAPGVAGSAVVPPRAGLRIMTLDGDSAAQAGPPRGRMPVQSPAGKVGGVRTSSADIALRPRPKPSIPSALPPRRRM